MITCVKITCKGYSANATYFGYNKLITIYDESLQVGVKLFSTRLHPDYILPVVTIKNIIHLNDDIVILEIDERFSRECKIGFNFTKFENRVDMSNLSQDGSVYGGIDTTNIIIFDNTPAVITYPHKMINGELICKWIHNHSRVDPNINIIGLCKISEEGKIFVLIPNIKHFYYHIGF